MKKRSAAFTLVVGAASAYALYLGLQLILAAFAIRTPISTKYLAAFQLLFCFVAVFTGGRIAACTTTRLGSLTSSLIVTVSFAVLVFLSGFLIYNRVGTAGQGIRFLLAVVPGGILAGIPAKKRKTRKRKR